MNVVRSYPLLRFLLILLAVTAQCLAMAAWGLLIVAGTLAALSWFVTEGPRARSLPGWVARLLVLAAAMTTVVKALGPGDGVPQALCQFVIWLTVIKLYDRRTMENEAQLLLLSLLLMVIGGLYATGLGYGIVLAVWTMLGCWVLLLYQLQHGTASMRQERYAAVPLDLPIPWTRPVTGRSATTMFRRSVITLLAVGMVASVAVFMVLPRSERAADDNTAQSGGDVTELALAPERPISVSGDQVMAVRLVDSDGARMRLAEPLRLRGAVLGRAGDGEIREIATSQPMILTSRSGTMTRLPHTGYRRSTIRQEVVLRRPMERIYAMYRPLAIETGGQTRIRYHADTHVAEVMPMREGLHTYAVEVFPESTIEGLPSEHARSHYQNDRVAALATDILAQRSLDPASLIAGTGEERTRAANALVDYLTSGQYTYSLGGVQLVADRSVQLADTRDPEETFLLATRSGHCEFFAASMAAMCDTIGLSSRVVTGYLCDRFDPATRQYIVLDSDAHAWVEVEVAPGSWATFDPTPAADGSPTQPSDMSWSDSIRYAWQRWETWWQTAVLGYDRDTQEYVLDTIDPVWREHAANASTDIRQTWAWIVSWFDIGTGGRLWFNLVLVSALASGVAVVVRLRRRRLIRQTLGLEDNTEQAVASIGFFADAIRLLARHGKVRPIWCPPVQWAASLHLPPLAASLLADLCTSFYAIRFGGHRPSTAEREALADAVARLDLMLADTS